jgi:hypothetical protein
MVGQADRHARSHECLHRFFVSRQGAGGVDGEVACYPGKVVV